MGRIFSWSCCEKFIQILDFEIDTTYISENNIHSSVEMKLSKLKRPFLAISTHLDHLLHIATEYYNVNTTIMKALNESLEADSSINFKILKVLNFPNAVHEYAKYIKEQLKQSVSYKTFISHKLS